MSAMVTLWNNNIGTFNTQLASDLMMIRSSVEIYNTDKPKKKQFSTSYINFLISRLTTYAADMNSISSLMQLYVQPTTKVQAHSR